MHRDAGFVTPSSFCPECRPLIAELERLHHAGKRFELNYRETRDSFEGAGWQDRLEAYAGKFASEIEACKAAGRVNGDTWQMLALAYRYLSEMRGAQTGLTEAAFFSTQNEHSAAIEEMVEHMQLIVDGLPTLN